MRSTSWTRSLAPVGAGALLVGGLALAASCVLTDAPERPRTRSAPAPRAPIRPAPAPAPAPAPSTPLAAPAPVASAAAPSASSDDARALREALEGARARGERPEVPTLLRALELHDLELALVALELLADVDPDAFRTTLLGLVGREDGDTVVLGAALLSLGRLQGADQRDALEATRRSQWSAVRALSRRVDASPGEVEQRRGYVRFAVDELVTRRSPSELAATLLDGRADAEERLLLAAALLDRDDAGQLLAPAEVAALSGLLAADLKAAAAAADEHGDEHGDDQLLDPADEAALRARIVVLASLPGEAGLEPLREVVARGELPRALVEFAGDAAR